MKCTLRSRHELMATRPRAAALDASANRLRPWNPRNPRERLVSPALCWGSEGRADCGWWLLPHSPPPGRPPPIPPSNKRSQVSTASVTRDPLLQPWHLRWQLSAHGLHGSLDSQGGSREGLPGAHPTAGPAALSQSRPKAPFRVQQLGFHTPCPSGLLWVAG